MESLLALLALGFVVVSSRSGVNPAARALTVFGGRSARTAQVGAAQLGSVIPGVSDADLAKLCEKVGLTFEQCKALAQGDIDKLTDEALGKLCEYSSDVGVPKSVCELIAGGVLDTIFAGGKTPDDSLAAYKHNVLATAINVEKNGGLGAVTQAGEQSYTGYMAGYTSGSPEAGEKVRAYHWLAFKFKNGCTPCGAGFSKCAPGSVRFKEWVPSRGEVGGPMQGC